MNDNYQTKVNGKQKFSLNAKAVEDLDILSSQQDSYHVIHQNQSKSVEVIQADFLKKSYTLSINGNSYQVEIQDNLDMLIKDLGFEVGASKQITSLESPMPGLILQVDVKAGDEVKEGDVLLILEAMKMENVISSPRDGIIKSVNVTQGEAIEKKHLLLEFE